MEPKTPDRRLSVRGLYAVTPTTADGAALLRASSEALEGGARLLQYRGKHLSASIQRQQASQLAALCKSAGALFIVNDDAALAADVGADGVHIGRDDGDISRARTLLGSAGLIGVSCYDSFDLALQAVERGADYVAFGSFFASPTKPHAVRPPLSLLTEAKEHLPVPVVAIGGITAENASSLLDAGADAVAVITALFDAPSVTAAARRFADLFR